MKENENVLNLPINSTKENMQNKKCDYKTLSIITVYSNKTPFLEDDSVEELYRYLYRNKLLAKSAEIEELSNLKINTVLKNVNKLSKLNNRMVNPVKTESGGNYLLY